MRCFVTQVEYLGSRQAMTTGANPQPIPNRVEYGYVLLDENSAEYCEASFLESVRMREAELYHRGKILVLGTCGASEKLEKLLFGGIQELKIWNRKRIMKHKPYGPYEKYIKCPQDFLCALFAIIVLSPVMLVTAVLVRVKLGSPVLFTQDRPGKDGKIFKLYKFRTMLPPKDGVIDPKQDADRLTPFGRKLRSTSLDELPELFNMLKGDMSVVGPRPLLVQYMDRYNEHQARRHEVRPGFTGLAQVHGRNAISWEEKFDWDVKYVDHISFLGDWKIIFGTVKTVLKREGISATDDATMAEFIGDKK